MNDKTADPVHVFAGPQNHTMGISTPVCPSDEKSPFHHGIRRSPYEAMFGRPLMLGNEDGNIPTMEERGLDEDENDIDVIFLVRYSIKFVIGRRYE